MLLSCVCSLWQVVYHSSAYLDLCRDGAISFGEPVDLCIPTGNFGNAVSAVYAKKMGVPIRKVICASNHNCVIADFLNTGEYDLRGRPLLASRSPAIDILKSSNLERFIHHASQGDGRLVRHLFTQLEAQRHLSVPQSLLRSLQQEVLAGWSSEDHCLAAIRRVHAQTGYVMDPHTAVAKVVAERLQDGSCPVVLCSTAHYGKFAPAVLEALGTRSVPLDPVEQLRTLASVASGPPVHRDLVACLDRRTGHAVCPPEYGALVEEVEVMIQDSFMKVL